MKIPEHIKDVIANQKVHVLSTSSRDGKPNTIYLTFLRIRDDEHVLIADNKFFKTEKNLKENPVLSFLVMDEKNRKAYQLKGRTEMYTEGEIFQETVRWVKERKPDLVPKAAVLMEVEEIYSGADRITA